MKTKQKVKYWLSKYSYLKDDDNKLCCNIWANEIKDLNYEYKDFLILYANGKLTSAPSIKRARAKLQEEDSSLRGKNYSLRKGAIQDKWRKDLGYDNH